MTKEVIEQLPELFRRYICTLKKASMDTTNKNSMCESEIRVIDFDRIPNEFSRGKGWNGVPKSNDALYIDVQGKWFFVEFKNGSIQKNFIQQKEMEESCQCNS